MGKKTKSVEKMKSIDENTKIERPYLDCDGKDLYINVDRIASKIPDQVKRTCENIRNYILKHPVKTIVGLTLLGTQIFWTNVGYKSTKYQLDNGKTRMEIESGIEKRMNDLPLKIIKLQTKLGRELAYIIHGDKEDQIHFLYPFSAILTSFKSCPILNSSCCLFFVPVHTSFPLLNRRKVAFGSINL